MIRNYSVGHATPFVGRTTELEDITQRLKNSECRILTLTGMGGSGKTRLALEAAQKMIPHFQHGTVFVNLQPLTRSKFIVPTIAQSLGTTFYEEADLQVQLLDYLHNKQMLLILDNFEHLLDGAELIATMLTAAPEVKVLVTSREALNLWEEWLYPLKGMTVPLSAYSQALDEYESARLFMYHARRIQPNFDAMAERESIIRICMLTGGLPLAIELAASWLKGSGVAHIAREMQTSLDFLSTTTRNFEQRHSSMRVVFDQSWRLLTESERLAFARLSIFPGGFDAEAAQEIAGVSFPALTVMVEKSLIQIEPSGRYAIHELLRQYGAEKLSEYNQVETIYNRHSEYYANWIRGCEAAFQQPNQLETIQAIERNFENIRLAWDWSVQHNRSANLHNMLNGLYLLGFLRSHYSEVITLFLSALEEPLNDSYLRARLLTRRWGYLHWLYVTDLQEALTDNQTSLAIATAKNEPFEVAFSHLMLGYTLISMGRYLEAIPHLEISRDIFESINEPYYASWALHRLGYVYYNINDTERSNAYTEQSLVLARQTYNISAEFTCLNNLASNYILDDNVVRARYYCAETLKIARASGHQDQIAYALSLVAQVAFAQEDYTTCRDYAEQSQLLMTDYGLRVFQPYGLQLLIIVTCLDGSYDEALRLWEASQRLGNSPCDQMFQYWSLALLACGLGKRDEVQSYIQKMMPILHPHGQPATIVWVVPVAVYLLAETDPAQAVEFLSWMSAYLDTTLNWVPHWSLFTPLQNQLQGRLNTATFEQHWEKGESLNFEAIKQELQHRFPTDLDIKAEAALREILTARENEILHLMASGMTNPEIAEHLVIGAGTVKTHTLNIYRKLDVANRTQAIVHAQEIGLL